MAKKSLVLVAALLVVCLMAVGLVGCVKDPEDGIPALKKHDNVSDIKYKEIVYSPDNFINYGGGGGTVKSVSELNAMLTTPEWSTEDAAKKAVFKDCNDSYFATKALIFVAFPYTAENDDGVYGFKLCSLVASADKKLIAIRFDYKGLAEEITSVDRLMKAFVIEIDAVNAPVDKIMLGQHNLYNFK